jgi:hypothetical protein
VDRSPPESRRPGRSAGRARPVGPAHGTVRPLRGPFHRPERTHPVPSRCTAIPVPHPPRAAGHRRSCRPATEPGTASSPHSPTSQDLPTNRRVGPGRRNRGPVRARDLGTRAEPSGTGLRRIRSANRKSHLSSREAACRPIAPPKRSARTFCTTPRATCRGIPCWPARSIESSSAGRHGPRVPRRTGASRIVGIRRRSRSSVARTPRDSLRADGGSDSILPTGPPRGSAVAPVRPSVSGSVAAETTRCLTDSPTDRRRSSRRAP